jgi:methylated-DNA-[protein]-cysteine S-methyltransferase
VTIRLQPPEPDVIRTPVGNLRIVTSEHGLCALDWCADDESGDGARDVRRQLAEYFAGTRRTFELELDPGGTAFQQRAWHALAEIPYGETRSYAQQAALLGLPRGARAVGSANARNPLPIVLPCHRLVGANGSLTGFAGGLEAKRWLLEHERANAR